MQLAYHALAYLFMSAAIAGAQLDASSAANVRRPPVTNVIAIMGIVAVLTVAAALQTKSTKRTMFLLRAYQVNCVFLTGATLYTLVLYRNTLRVKDLPSGLVGRLIASKTGWHSGACIHLAQGLEVTLDMMGAAAAGGDGKSARRNATLLRGATMLMDQIAFRVS